MLESGSTRQEALFWLTCYFSFSLILTIYNKAVLQFYSFPYPWLLTAVHTLCGWIGCRLLAFRGTFTPSTLSKDQKRTIFWFSILYTINIAASNVSLNMVTVPFHQVARAMVPVFTIILSKILFAEKYTSMTYISLIPVVVGVPLATFGDYYATTMGVIATFIGTALASIKTIVTNKVQFGPTKLHPLDILLHMSPLSFIETMFFALCAGEVQGLSSQIMASEYTIASPEAQKCILALVGNGCIAFGLNYVSFTANGKTSPLMMCVAGNMKQVMSIILAVMIFHLQVNAMNAIGILLTLVGGAWYAVIELERKKKKTTGPLLDGKTPLLKQDSQKLKSSAIPEKGPYNA